MTAIYDAKFPIYLAARKAMRPVWRGLGGAR